MNTYQQRAAQTKSRRQYPTNAQRDAMKKLIRLGERAMTAGEFALLATHPYASVTQRSRFAELSVNWS